MDITTLAAAAWDLRASVEAQIRSLTALQRCIDGYRESRDPDAVELMARLLDSVARKHADIRATLPIAADALRRLAETSLR